MHPEFSGRLRAVVAEPDADYVRVRWAAVEWLADKPTEGRIYELVSVAFSGGWPNQETLDELVSFAQEEDPHFDPRALREHAILAACALERILESDSNSVLAGLAVSCASMGGIREAKDAPFLAPFAETFLEKRSTSRLESPTKRRGKLAIPTEKWTEITDLSKANNHPDAFAKLIELIQSLQASNNGAHSAIADLKKRQRLFEEELDMLWWLKGGRTRDEKISFGDAKAGHLALVSAHELADLTRVPPGPLSVLDFIQSALTRIEGFSTRPKSLKPCVNEVPRPWRHEFAESLGDISYLAISVPVTIAIREAARSSSWKDAFEHDAKLSLSACRLPLPQFGLQLYRELLLLDMSDGHQDG